MKSNRVPPLLWRSQDEIHRDRRQFSQSFDVDKATIPALANFPFETHPFTFMTFEHDLYRDGGLVKKQHCIERLRQGNYRIVAENVMFGEKPFEDWWVNLDRINPAILQCYTRNVTWQVALDKVKLYKH